MLSVGLDVDVLIVRTYPALDLNLTTNMKMKWNKELQGDCSLRQAYNFELVEAIDGDETTSASDHEENLSQDD